MHPKDGNYMVLKGVKDIQVEDANNQSSPKTMPDATLHTYASAAAYDAATDSSHDWDSVPDETEASAAGNRTVPVFSTAPPLSSSVAHLGSYRVGESRHQCPPSIPIVDLNSSTPTSAAPVFGQSTDTTAHVGLQPSLGDSPALHSPQTMPLPHGTQSSMRGGSAAPNLPRVPLNSSPTIHPQPASLTRGRLRLHRQASSATSTQEAIGGRPSQPHLISSSETSAPPGHRTPTSGNIGVKRKTHGGIKLVADATLEGSDHLVAGLKEINDIVKDMKLQEM
jgi:hypothetical protein